MFEFTDFFVVMGLGALVFGRTLPHSTTTSRRKPQTSPPTKTYPKMLCVRVCAFMVDVIIVGWEPKCCRQRSLDSGVGA